MIAAVVLAAQTSVVPAPGIDQAYPATSWDCRFTTADGSAMQLEGRFPEAPAGWDPNAELPTEIKGDAPAFFLGKKGVNAFESTPGFRMYAVSFLNTDSSRYTIILNLLKDTDGLATISHYVPGSDGGKGKLLAHAIGNCRSSFHEAGAKGPAK